MLLLGPQYMPVFICRNISQMSQEKKNSTKIIFYLNSLFCLALISFLLALLVFALLLALRLCVCFVVEVETH